MKTFTKLAIAAGIFTASLTAMAAFSTGMSAAQVEAEVKKSVTEGQDVSAVVAAAKAAGISVDSLATALSAAGVSTDAIQSAMTTAGYDAKQVGDTVAVLKLVNESKATAAGNPTNAPGNPGITTGPSNAPSWSNAPASTPSGGGGGGVSRS